jgi:hypothetical protein
MGKWLSTRKMFKNYVDNNIPHLGSYCSTNKVLINFHEASIEISIKSMLPLAFFKPYHLSSFSMHCFLETSNEKTQVFKKIQK